MLAMADRKGRVFASVPGLANRSRVPIEDAQTAIDTFMSPDKYSRTPEFEGRRIEPIDGGWRLLNHEKYRSIRDEETTKEHKRNYINKRRAAEKQSTVDHETSTVERCRDNAEADTEAESVKKKTTSSRAATTFVPPDWVPAEQWSSFIQMRKAMKSVPFTNAAAAGVVRELWKLVTEGNDAASLLDTAVMNGWRTVYPPKSQQSRIQPSGETAYQRSMRERMQQAVPSIAAKAPGQQNVIDMEAFDATPRRLG
jgi:hypothetical protein